MFHENATIPAEEPTVAVETASAAHRKLRLADQIGGEGKDLSVEEPVQSAPNTTPWWILEKFFWKQTAAGNYRLSPLPDFMQRVTDDTSNLLDYGVTLVLQANRGSSTEMDLVKTLVEELDAVKSSLNTLAEREVTALQKYFQDRAERSAVYAAITQFEIDNWVNRSIAKGQDPTQNSSYTQKQDRRDEFARIAATLYRVAKDLNRHYTPALEKTARSVIYQQADMNTRDCLQPSVPNVETLSPELSAVATLSRPF